MKLRLIKPEEEDKQAAVTETMRSKKEVAHLCCYFSCSFIVPLQSCSIYGTKSHSVIFRTSHRPVLDRTEVLHQTGRAPLAWWVRCLNHCSWRAGAHLKQQRTLPITFWHQTWCEASFLNLNENVNTISELQCRTNGLEDSTRVIWITFMVFFVLSSAWQTYSQCLWAANLISWQKDWYGLQKQHRIRPELQWRTRTGCAFICCWYQKKKMT